MSVVRHASEANLAWIDLEMTGLDPEVDVILQAALIVTRPDLTVLEEFAVDVWQPAAALAGMTPYVRKMHQETGLLDRVAASRVELRSAEKQLLERIAGWCTYPAVIAGNTIGMDRRFIDRHMLGLAGFLHYRTLDVSSLKLLAKLWYGPGAVYKKPEAGAHDALVDIRHSIAELAHYRARHFVPATP